MRAAGRGAWEWDTFLGEKKGKRCPGTWSRDGFFMGEGGLVGEVSQREGDAPSLRGGERRETPGEGRGSGTRFSEIKRGSAAPGLGPGAVFYGGRRGRGGRPFSVGKGGAFFLEWVRGTETHWREAGGGRKGYGSLGKNREGVAGRGPGGFCGDLRRMCEKWWGLGGMGEN